MFYTIPSSSKQIIANTPIGAKSIRYLFFQNKNDKLFQYKQQPDKISISIDGRQICRDLLVLPFCTGAPDGTQLRKWQDVAIEINLNVDFSEIKIDGGADNDFNIVFVCSDKEVDETKGFEFWETKSIPLKTTTTQKQILSTLKSEYKTAYQKAVEDAVLFQNQIASNVAKLDAKHEAILADKAKWEDYDKAFVSWYESLYSPWLMARGEIPDEKLKAEYDACKNGTARPDESTPVEPKPTEPTEKLEEGNASGDATTNGSDNGIEGQIMLLADDGETTDTGTDTTTPDEPVTPPTTDGSGDDDDEDVLPTGPTEDQLLMAHMLIYKDFEEQLLALYRWVQQEGYDSLNAMNKEEQVVTTNAFTFTAHEYSGGNTITIPSKNVIVDLTNFDDKFDKVGWRYSISADTLEAIKKLNVTIENENAKTDTIINSSIGMACHGYTADSILYGSEDTKYWMWGIIGVNKFVDSFFLKDGFEFSIGMKLDASSIQANDPMKKRPYRPQTAEPTQSSIDAAKNEADTMREYIVTREDIEEKEKGKERTFSSIYAPQYGEPTDTTITSDEASLKDKSAIIFSTISAQQKSFFGSEFVFTFDHSPKKFFAINLIKPVVGEQLLTLTAPLSISFSGTDNEALPDRTDLSLFTSTDELAHARVEYTFDDQTGVHRSITTTIGANVDPKDMKINNDAEQWTMYLLFGYRRII